MKLKELYNKNGYLNMSKIISLPYDYIAIVGGRATGKTYGTLKEVIEQKLTFAYIRRTQTQSDIITTPELSPFKKLNQDMGWNIQPAKVYKYVSGWYNSTIEEGKMKIDKDTLYGYSMALSTFSNIRGFDGCDIDIVIYDEFIPQKGERALSYEADSFFNMIETINRNREDFGKPPVKVICLANASDIANPIFVELKLVTSLFKRKSAKEFVCEYPDKGLCVIFPINSPISQRKKETSLYKLTEGTNFYDNAIENEFVYNVPTKVCSHPLNEYIPVCIVGELCIYKHKNSREYYVSTHISGSPQKFGVSPKELRIFQHRYPLLRAMILADKVTYESYSCEILFDKYTDFCYT